MEIFLALFKGDERLVRKSFHLNSKFDLVILKVGKTTRQTSLLPTVQTLATRHISSIMTDAWSLS